MPLFPAFLDIAGRDVLIVGGGTVAAAKIGRLLPFRPRLTVIARGVRPEIERWANEGRLRLERRPFHPGDTAGRFLVIVATDDQALQAVVKRECEQSGILCNVVDVPSLCDFVFPALIVKGDIVIGISTSGQGPAVAAALRRWLERHLPADLEERLRTVVEYRNRLPRGHVRQAKVIELTRALFGEEDGDEGPGAHHDDDDEHR